MLSKISRIKNDKKAQVGGTITWFVATIIIILILLIAVYAAGILGKSKHFSFDSDEIGNIDSGWVDVKNDVAFEKDSSNKEKIEKWLNNKTLEDS